MRNIADRTPKLKPEDSADDAFVAALFDDYCRKFMAAEQTNSLAEAVTAGYARSRFIKHFEKLPGVSAGGSE